MEINNVDNMIYVDDFVVIMKQFVCFYSKGSEEYGFVIQGKFYDHQVSCSTQKMNNDV